MMHLSLGVMNTEDEVSDRRGSEVHGRGGKLSVLLLSTTS